MGEGGSLRRPFSHSGVRIAGYTQQGTVFAHKGWNAAFGILRITNGTRENIIFMKRSIDIRTEEPFPVSLDSSRRMDKHISFWDVPT